MALCEAIEAGRVKKNDRLVFVSFGAGLTWAAMAIQWGAPVPVPQPKWWQEAQRQGAYGAARARSTVRRLLRKYNSLAEDIRVPEIELPERFRVLGLGKRDAKKHEQDGNE